MDLILNGYNNAAASLLDVWRILFPAEAAKVDAFQTKFADQLEILKFYRDNTAFHGNQQMTRYISSTRKLLKDVPEMSNFFSEFENLNELFLSSAVRGNFHGERASDLG